MVANLPNFVYFIGKMKSVEIMSYADDYIIYAYGKIPNLLKSILEILSKRMIQ